MRGLKPGRGILPEISSAIIQLQVNFFLGVFRHDSKEKEGIKLIECKIYTLSEFKDCLGITKHMWETRKDEVLDWLKLYFDYEIISQGRGYKVQVKKQYMEYDQLPRKSKVPEIQAFYEAETDHILQYKPRNTGANIAREIEAKNNKFNHKDGTIAHYVRPYLKKNYYVDDKEWCSINYAHFTYDKITDEELKYLNQQFNKYLSSTQTAAIIADAEAGYSTKDEAYAKLRGCYDNAMRAFKDKYGFRPYKAGVLRRKIEFGEPIEEE